VLRCNEASSQARLESWEAGKWRQRKGRNALSSQGSLLWRKGPTTLVRNADLAWARVFIGGRRSGLDRYAISAELNPARLWDHPKRRVL
jgi:hypothetical protein